MIFSSRSGVYMYKLISVSFSRRESAYLVSTEPSQASTLELAHSIADHSPNHWRQASTSKKQLSRLHLCAGLQATFTNFLAPRVLFRLQLRVSKLSNSSCSYWKLRSILGVHIAQGAHVLLCYLLQNPAAPPARVLRQIKPKPPLNFSLYEPRSLPLILDRTKIRSEDPPSKPSSPKSIDREAFSHWASYKPWPETFKPVQFKNRKTTFSFDCRRPTHRGLLGLLQMELRAR